MRDHFLPTAEYHSCPHDRIPLVCGFRLRLVCFRIASWFLKMVAARFWRLGCQAAATACPKRYLMSSRTIRAIASTGLIVLTGSLVSACASSDQSASPPSGASWARNLNESPPRRESADVAVAPVKSDLNTARERISH